MGPTILFDKSAIQSLGQAALQEISRYFYTVVPPVLLMEILADLSLTPNDVQGAKKKVADIANKVFPIDSIANAHCHLMCVHNLLGDVVPMTRVPAICGARPVVAKDGSNGIFIDVQPENEAVMRWRNGQFNQDDLACAIQWRTNANRSNLEEMKKLLPKLPGNFRTGEQVKQVVDGMLSQPEFQEALLHWFINLLHCDSETRQRIVSRWQKSMTRSLAIFAPYAHHCLRVQLIFYMGMMQNVFGTRPSNIVDLEYLSYTPFVQIFCSGDKLHKQLAPMILNDDQSFVSRDEMHRALTEMADARVVASNAQPSEQSLIRQLWLKHGNLEPPTAVRRTISENVSKLIMESAKPIMDALQEQEKRINPRFPV